jgi:ATP-dependent RNA helicase DHX36
MLRTRLEEVVLQIKSLELGKASSFLGRVMEPPSPDAVSHAIELLRTINALNEKEQLTPLGYHLASSLA